MCVHVCMCVVCMYVCVCLRLNNELQQISLMSCHKYACASPSLSKIEQYPAFIFVFKFVSGLWLNILKVFPWLNQIFFQSQNIVIGRKALAETRCYGDAFS